MTANSAVGGHADVADREVDDPARPVDEHDAHRDERGDQPADDALEDQVPGDDRCASVISRPRSRRTPRGRGRRVRGGPARRPFELHLALLEEDRPVGDRERDVERLLDDDHRLAARLQLLDDLEQALHDDRREPERELVDHQDLGLVDQHAAEREHLLLAARQARRRSACAAPRARGTARTRRRSAASHLAACDSALSRALTARFCSTVRLREHAVAAGELHDAEVLGPLLRRRRR